MIDNILLGVQTALSFQTLLYLFVGVLLGNIVGVLPGIGALAAISMLLPITYSLDHITALVMLGGLYYGTTFGGATTSILLNLPGTAAHAVLCLDGHPLARQGRAGPAIFMAMFASFVGVTTGIVIMAYLAPALSELAFLFGPWEYSTLMVVGLVAAASIGSENIIMGVASVICGLILGTVGMDMSSSVERFTFDLPELSDGLSIVALAMAFFGINDVLRNAGKLTGNSVVLDKGISSDHVRPSRADIRDSRGAIARGSILGSVIGALPGAGSAISSFMSYAMEKRIGKDKKLFGKGAIAGVAGPEAANSAGAITSFIPTLVLGIPGGPVMALMLGVLLIHDVTPGPQLLTEQSAMFWGLLVSFWLGNMLLMVLNIPLIQVWVKLLTIPYRWIFPFIVFLIMVGVYSGRNSFFDIGVVLVLGLAANGLRRINIEGAPLLIGFVLGPMLEEYFRRAMLIGHGDWTSFLTRPISGSIIAVCGIFVALLLMKKFRRA